MNFLKNNETYLRTTEFLLDQIRKKGYDWRVEKMRPMDGELYANAQVDPSGAQNLLTGSSKEEKGITNFNGNKLVKNRVFVANGIAFGWGQAAAGTAPHAVEYNYKEIPAFLAQATIVLKQHDEVVLKLPIASIINANGRGNQSVYRELGALSLIEDEAIIEYTIEFPAGVSASLEADKVLYVSAYLRGLETYVKR